MLSEEHKNAESDGDETGATKMRTLIEMALSISDEANLLNDEIWMMTNYVSPEARYTSEWDMLERATSALKANAEVLAGMFVLCAKEYPEIGDIIIESWDVTGDTKEVASKNEKKPKEVKEVPSDV
jgi:hypothetical protein